ncbi:OmpA family protein [Thiotrichales bacterium HSG1]|nr:OmpA family protein [Thiotrichales bacterium HSG1]
MIFLKTNILIILLNLIFLSQAVATEACEQANDLLYQAYDLYSKQDSFSQQKQLLKRAIKICPKAPKIHNALAFVLENKGEHHLAIKHYKLALQQNPKLYEAWYDLAELYYEQNQFILSLEAYLNICITDKDAKEQIKLLLDKQRYAVVDSGKVVSKENLLLLYGNNNFNRKLFACGIDSQIQPAFLFYNLKFKHNVLHSTSYSQLDEIAATLRELYTSTIEIHAHTDAFTSSMNRDELNLKLSQKHAETIANALVERGISAERIGAVGHGYRKPIAYGTSPEVVKKNTRIEIVSF